MTQVPEYLLERSRARRAALGLGGDAPAPAEASGGSSEAPAGAASGSGQATAVAEVPTPVAASSAPAVPAAPAAPLPDYIRDPGPRSGIPYWMMPVLLILPLWGILYLGAFGETQQVELTGIELGAQVYGRSCASCHGATGGGGVGPPLSGGQAKLTFPNEPDHIAWIETGSSAKRGQPYGDPGRAGGQKIAASGGMPGFAGQLTAEEIAAVVLFERDGM